MKIAVVEQSDELSKYIPKGSVMMMLQLSPALPVNTPKGEGLAHILIDYGFEHDLQWTVFINKTGECWTFSNKEVRATKNITMGRMLNEGS